MAVGAFWKAEGQKQASWRTDPAKSGAAGSIGDIGTHAENLAEYITGLTDYRGLRRCKHLCRRTSTR